MKGEAARGAGAGEPRAREGAGAASPGTPVNPPSIEATAIPDVKLITPRQHRDDRGVLVEVYSDAAYAAAGFHQTFVQDNHAWSAAAGTVRGLHFQAPPHAQGKLVRVSHGAALDVAVDVRRDSPTFGRHVAVELSRENARQLWVPPGFAHGYCTLEPGTVVEYRLTAYYAPASDRGVRWDDPALGIDWPVDPARATVSDRDRANPVLADLPDYFGEDA